MFLKVTKNICPKVEIENVKTKKRGKTGSQLEPKTQRSQISTLFDWATMKDINNMMYMYNVEKTI